MSVSKYQDKFCKEIISLASSGKSMIQICAKWSICKKTLGRWKQDKEEFQAAYDIAKICYEAYWEDIGQKGAKGMLPKFNPAAWRKMMESRCSEDWSDKTTQKIELKNEVSSMTSEEIDDTIKTLLAQRTLNKIKSGPLSGEPLHTEQ